MAKHAPRGPLKSRTITVEDPLNGFNPLKCRARSKRSGKQCGKPPIAGGTVCRMHGGAAPQVRAKAIERLNAYQDRAIDRLFGLVEQQEYPSTAYQAVRDVLDRTMGKPAETVAMNVTGAIDVIAILKQRQERHRANG